MAMGRFFAKDLESFCHRRGTSSKISKSRKIVYLSPSKALCEERYKDWNTRLIGMDLGIVVAVVTGDGDPSESFRDIATSHLILTTPEKWDSVTRRWTENFFLFATVKLFMIDEVHLIADENRGCCLESIVCRMKTIHRAACNAKFTEEDIARSR
jgi:ATP-dependent DNA helicase HFM1/MER3